MISIDSVTLPTVIDLMNRKYISMIQSGYYTDKQIDDKKKELLKLYKAEREYREYRIKQMEKELELMDEQIENGLTDYE